jgi:hypothetical protein
MILHRMSMTMPGRGHEGRLYKDDVTDEERVAGSAWTVDKGIRQQTPPGGVTGSVAEVGSCTVEPGSAAYSSAMSADVHSHQAAARV